MSCDSDKIYDSQINTCTWDTSSSAKFLGLNSAWVASWDFGLTSTKSSQWMRNCPEDSEDLSSFLYPSTARTKSSPTNWYNLSRHFYFTQGVTKGLQILKFDMDDCCSYSIPHTPGKGVYKPEKID